MHRLNCKKLSFFYAFFLILSSQIQAQKTQLAEAFNCAAAITQLPEPGIIVRAYTSPSVEFAEPDRERPASFVPDLPRFAHLDAIHPPSQFNNPLLPYLRLKLDLHGLQILSLSQGFNFKNDGSSVSLPGAFLEFYGASDGRNPPLILPLIAGYDTMLTSEARQVHRPHRVIALSFNRRTAQILALTTENSILGRVQIHIFSLGDFATISARFNALLLGKAQESSTPVEALDLFKLAMNPTTENAGITANLVSQRIIDLRSASPNADLLIEKIIPTADENIILLQGPRQLYLANLATGSVRCLLDLETLNQIQLSFPIEAGLGGKLGELSRSLDARIQSVVWSANDRLVVQVSVREPADLHLLPGVVRNLEGQATSLKLREADWFNQSRPSTLRFREDAWTFEFEIPVEDLKWTVKL